MVFRMRQSPFLRPHSTKTELHRKTKFRMEIHFRNQYVLQPIRQNSAHVGRLALIPAQVKS